TSRTPSASASRGRSSTPRKKDAARLLPRVRAAQAALTRSALLLVGRRPAPGRAVDATSHYGCALVIPAAPEPDAPPGAPEHERDQEDQDPDDHQNHADDLRVDAAAARVDGPCQDRPERNQDQADHYSHGGLLPGAWIPNLAMRLGGFEPPTHGLEGRCSSTELQA